MTVDVFMCVRVLGGGGVCAKCSIKQKNSAVKERQGRMGKYDRINNVGGRQEMSQKSGDTLIKPFAGTTCAARSNIHTYC